LSKRPVLPALPESVGTDLQVDLILAFCGTPNCYNPKMISRLRGTLLEKQADRAVVDVGGVGYEVWIPFSTYYDLPGAGNEVNLQIYTYVKEDALNLYGFLTREEKSLFSLLIQISGIGPRLAVTILSGLPARELARAVTDGDVARLTGIPGIGRKTAERIVLEMREKVSKYFPTAEAPASAAFGSLQRDVVSALVNLGYPKNVAEKAVSETARQGGGDRFDSLLRASLKKMTT